MVRNVASRKRSRRRKRKTSVSRFVISLAGLLAFAAIGPTLATSVGGLVAGVVTRDLVPHTACVTGPKTSPTPTARQSGSTSGDAPTSQRQKKKARAGAPKHGKVAKARTAQKPTSVVSPDATC